MATKTKWDNLISTSANLSNQVALNSRSYGNNVKPKHRRIFEMQSKELLDSSLNLASTDPAPYMNTTVKNVQDEINQALKYAAPLNNPDQSVVENFEAIFWLERLIPN